MCRLIATLVEDRDHTVRDLLDRGDFANAAAHLQVAAGLSPDKDYIHYQLQLAYRKLGRNADADRELEIYKGLKSQARARVAEAIRQQSH